MEKIESFKRYGLKLECDYPLINYHWQNKIKNGKYSESEKIWIFYSSKPVNLLFKLISKSKEGKKPDKLTEQELKILKEMLTDLAELEKERKPWKKKYSIMSVVFSHLQKKEYVDEHYTKYHYKDITRVLKTAKRLGIKILTESKFIHRKTYIGIQTIKWFVKTPLIMLRYGWIIIGGVTFAIVGGIYSRTPTGFIMLGTIMAVVIGIFLQLEFEDMLDNIK
ncbi:hypothetical protein HOK51_02960 [Candidatus Woesearchaeota archaeon]|nr:hypothetical protein [Candidatus Woesearchaeota archaeon]MBT6518778.1 hypothetical protein [Candidatus Woesearchaeota archaeon]MBT7366920.1 hypothetical protein [Candidatus Woesearchaeota archaeon]